MVTFGLHAPSMGHACGTVSKVQPNYPGAACAWTVLSGTPTADASTMSATSSIVPIDRLERGPME